MSSNTSENKQSSSSSESWSDKTQLIGFEKDSIDKKSLKDEFESESSKDSCDNTSSNHDDNESNHEDDDKSEEESKKNLSHDQVINDKLEEINKEET